MAVISISRIQVRRGLQEQLPQLASGEMGWSVDTRKLFIGNGTLVEGAPEIGNTEILTVHSGFDVADLTALQGNVANLNVVVGGVSSNISIVSSQVANLTANISYLSSQHTTLINNTVSPANILVVSGSTIVDYRITRADAARAGILKISEFYGATSYEDDYTETQDTGVTLGVTTFGNGTIFTYTTTNTGDNATIDFYIRTFI